MHIQNIEYGVRFIYFFYCVKPNIKFIEIIHMNLDITQANTYNIKVWAYVINIRHNSLIYGNLEFL